MLNSLWGIKNAYKHWPRLQKWNSKQWGKLNPKIEEYMQYMENAWEQSVYNKGVYIPRLNNICYSRVHTIFNYTDQIECKLFIRHSKQECRFPIKHRISSLFRFVKKNVIFICDFFKSSTNVLVYCVTYVTTTLYL